MRPISAPAVARLSRIPATDERGRKRKATEPDGSWGWFLVFNSFVCNMIVDGMQYTFANFLTPMALTFNSPIPQVSLIGSLLSGFYNFSGPVAGALGNKFGFRMVAITGSIISGTGLMVSYWAPSVQFLYFFYGVLGGLGFGMIYMASVITTSVHFDRYRALAVSISVCGTGVVVHCNCSRPAELLKMVPISPEASELRLSGSRGSSYYTAERRRTLPNEAYPTLKEAIIYQEDTRRSTIISLMPISEVNSENSSLSSAPFYATEFPMSKKQKCQNCCRICCFNVWHCRCHKRDLTLGDRPMYRDDVFYGSNVSRMKYSDDEIINYHLSVTRIPDAREVTEHLQQKCCVCHHAFLRTCLTMTGLNLLKSKIFAFLCISSFFYTMALYMPYVFIKDFGMQCHVPKETSVWLVSAIGISNTAGRLASGIIKSFFKVNSALLVLTCLLISGLYSFVFLFCCNLGCLFSYSCVFGFFTAPFISLRPVIIVDFLGLEKLTNAFGLVLLCQGVASIIGPPIAGVVVSAGKGYAIVMYIAGSLLVTSSMSLLVSTLLHKMSARKE
ncbi:hypothetical protein RUM44_012999 [Polyplax serrata]|uniref:Uncharacterized protein n=1 Tax=Polyplax serrata TaxID=468196 RepID=A0ABR1BF20_POLSC